MGTVKYLMDTHTLLWAVQKDVKLSINALRIIEDTDTQLFVSAVSAYEIRNKYRIGKLPGYEYIANHYFDILREFGAKELYIDTRHAHYAGKFEWTHRDPFDRLLAAQAFIENMTIITTDEVFKSLPWVSVLW